MAALSETERRAVWADFMRELSNERDPLPLLKTDLRAAVDALDDFLVANAAAVNNAIPEPAKSALTTAQKARLLMFVVRKRYIEGA